MLSQPPKPSLFPYTTLFRSLLVCPAAQVGQPFSLQLRALAGCDLYRWEITNGSLPAGLTISSGGLVSGTPTASGQTTRSEEHTSELQSHSDLVCRLLLEKKK